MTNVGVVCAADESRLVKWGDCLACAKSGQNPCHFTYELLKTVAPSEWHSKGIHISQLTNCLRRLRLDAEYDYYVRPIDTWKVLIGQLRHKGLEVTADGSAKTERSYLRLLSLDDDKAVPIVGRIDHQTETRITDYKNVFGRFSGPKPRHVLQIQAYWWLANNPNITELELVYLTSGRPIRCRVPINPDIDEWLQYRVEELLSPALPPIDATAVQEKWCVHCNLREQCALRAERGE